MFIAVSADDPFYIHPQDVAPGPDAYRRLDGKTVRDPRLISGERTGVLIVAGQSLTCNNVPTTYSPTHGSKCDQINVFDGAAYALADPLLGCDAVIANFGNVFTRVADKLIGASVFDRVILIPIGAGGTSIEQWIGYQSLFGRLITAFRRAEAVGLSVSAVLWEQGQADAGSAQATYQANLNTLIAMPRALGYDAPWLIAKSTYASGASDANVRAAQAAIVNGTDIFAGPDTDTLIGANRNSGDNTHWSDTGASAAADLWVAAIDAVF